MPVYIPQVWMVAPRALTATSATEATRALDSTGARLMLTRPVGTKAAGAIGGDYPSWLPSDEGLRVQEINWKVLDGTNWMAQFDERGVSGPGHFRQMALDFERSGIRLTPWNVPVGRSITQEVQQLSSVLDQMHEPSLVLDVEFWGDPYFWQGGKANIFPYMEELRKLQPKAVLTLQYDTRNPDTIHLAEWLPFVDKVVDMSYWPDFGRPMAEVLSTSYQRMKALGKPFSFTFPGTADAYPDWPIDESPIYIFRRGNMTPACVALVQSSDRPKPPQPPVSPPVTMEGVKLGLIDKVLREDWCALRDDVLKLSG